MSQGEDAENKISFECLRTMVDEVVETKNLGIIDKIEKEKLRYVQKYAESVISHYELIVSSNSLVAGVMGLVFGFFALGLSIILSILFTVNSSVLKAVLFILGAIMMGVGFLAVEKVDKARKEFKKREKDIEFMRNFILKIEEKLLS